MNPPISERLRTSRAHPLAGVVRHPTCATLTRSQAYWMAPRRSRAARESSEAVSCFLRTKPSPRLNTIQYHELTTRKRLAWPQALRRRTLRSSGDGRSSAGGSFLGRCYETLPPRVSARRGIVNSRGGGNRIELSRPRGPVFRQHRPPCTTFCSMLSDGVRPGSVTLTLPRPSLRIRGCP